MTDSLTPPDDVQDAVCAAAASMNTDTPPSLRKVLIHICEGGQISPNTAAITAEYLLGNPQRIASVGGRPVIDWLTNPTPAVPSDIAAAADGPTFTIGEQLLDNVGDRTAARLEGAVQVAANSALLALSRRAKGRLSSREFSNNTDIVAAVGNMTRDARYWTIPADIRATLSFDEQAILAADIEDRLGPEAARIIDAGYDEILAAVDAQVSEAPEDDNRRTGIAVELLIGLLVARLIGFLNPNNPSIPDRDIADDPIDAVGVAAVVQTAIDAAGGIAVDAATGLTDATPTGLLIPDTGTPRPSGTGLAGPWLNETLDQYAVDTSSTFRWRHVTSDPARHAAALAAGRTADFDPHLVLNDVTWVDDLERAERLAMSPDDWPHFAVAVPRQFRGCACRITTTVTATIGVTPLAAV